MENTLSIDFIRNKAWINEGKWRIRRPHAETWALKRSWTVWCSIHKGNWNICDPR